MDFPEKPTEDLPDQENQVDNNVSVTMEFEDDNPYAQEIPNQKKKKNLEGFSKNLKGL